jgi:hypothetical protein
VIENRVKECQTGPFAGRTSTNTMAANQRRPWSAAGFSTGISGSEQLLD